MSDIDNLKDKYEKQGSKLADNVKSLRSLTKQLEGKKDSAPVRAAKQAVSGFRSQWSGIDDEGKVGIGKGVPGIYYDTVAIPALAGIVDEKYAPEFAVEADKKAGKIREAVRKDMGIEAPKGALEHFANAGGTMLAQVPIPGAILKRVLSPVKNTGVAGKVATSPVEYLSPIVEPKAINYGVGTGFGGAIGTVGEMLEEDPVKKALGGLIQKYETGGRVGKVKSFFSAIDSAIDTLKQKKGTGEQILKEIEKAPGVKKEELELRKISEKLRDKKSITQDEVRALAAESPAPSVKPVIYGGGVPADWQPTLTDAQKQLLDDVGLEPVVNPEDRTVMAYMNTNTGELIDRGELKLISATDFGLDSKADIDKFYNAKILADDINRQFMKSQGSTKFEKYTTPGGKNYREVLLTLPGQKARADNLDEAFSLWMEDAKAGKRGQYSPEELSAITVDDVQDILKEEYMTPKKTDEYRSGHFDEPNVLVHARVTDRAGPNGEKVLYVEEIQSDWHQAARKSRDQYIDSGLSRQLPGIRGQAERQALEQGIDITTDFGKRQLTSITEQLKETARKELGKTVPKDVAYAKPMTMFEGLSADDLLWEHGDKMSAPQKEWLRDYIERWELDVDGTPAGQAVQDRLVKEYDDWLKSNQLAGIPDAPFKNTSNEIAVKQILDMAANEGYDSVAFSPGSEHVKRYGMSQYLDTLTGKKDSSGLISISGFKNDSPVVDKKGIRPEELADYVGKEKADKILSDLEASGEFMLKGQDLEMTTKEGAGKKKIYDEIIPNYVRKYAKKEFGVEPGEMEIPIGRGTKTYEQYLDDINADPYQHFDEDQIFDELHERVMDKAVVKGYDIKDDTVWDQMMSREGPFDDLWSEAEQQMYQAKAKELAEKDPGEKLRAFSVPVTPEMREKITTKGQPLFSVAAPVAVGAPQVVPEAEAPSETEAAQEAEEMQIPMPFQSGGQASSDREESYYEEPIVRMVRDAAKQYVSGKDIESGQFGVAAGPVTIGRQIANIREPSSNEYINAQADFARLAQKYGKGELTASVMKPDNTKGLYMGDVMASYPVGPGRVMAGVRGMKTPEKTDVTGYNVGYSGKVGPGYMNAMVMQPKDRRQDRRYEVGYALPFQSGGPVGLQGGGRVGNTRAAAEKLMRVLHGGPSSVRPEAGRPMDVTTESGYAVKRGADKMMGKSGPPMVNRFDIPQGRLLQFEEQYSPEDVALMKRFFNKLPEGQAMRGEEIFDAAQGRDAILEGIAKAGGFAGYERPNTGAVGKGQWFRITEPEELKRGKKRGGIV